MKTIHRFVLRSYFGPMILTFFIVMFVMIMQFVWRYIDEMVGKGLDTGVILELMGYAGITSIPLGLPLATLLAAIMTLGNLGENYELLAMKSAGMSLWNITKPIFILIFFVSIASFFVANNLVPYAWKRTFALLYDIRQQKQTIEFKDGVFFNGIDNISIRVGHQDPHTQLLTDVLIYDARDGSGLMTTTVAEKGYIRPSQDNKNLLVTLYNGQKYDQKRNYEWWDDVQLTRQIFEKQDGVISLTGFDFSRTDNELFSTGQTKNIVQLSHDIDSLRTETRQASMSSYSPLLKAYLYVKDSTLARPAMDSMRLANAAMRHSAMLEDSIAKMDIDKKKQIWNEARAQANGSRGLMSFDEETAKESLTQLYRHQVEWHRKLSLPASIMIFFLIGASLGAIIRKGGLGMPVVVSVAFFVIYYIISISGEKFAREGTWAAVHGVWISTYLLLPLALFLIYKATNDSNLFDADWYITRYRRIVNYVKDKYGKAKSAK